MHQYVISCGAGRRRPFRTASRGSCGRVGCGGVTSCRRVGGWRGGEGRGGPRTPPGPASRPAWPVSPPAPAPLPPGVRDLALGNPDPDLLPDLRPYLRVLADGPQPPRRLYGDPAQRQELVEL